MIWTDNIWGAMPQEGLKISKKKLARLRNQHEVTNWIEDGVTTALNIYEWHGLPDTCDARMLERSALLYGRYMIAKIGDSYITPACTPGAGYNIYGYPIKAWGWGLNGFNREFSVYIPGADTSREVLTASSGVSGTTRPEAVVGYDNADGFPFINYILTAAYRMADTMRAADVAVQNLKSPAVIFCDETQKSTIDDILKSRDENVATVIAVKGSVTENDVKFYPTNMDHEILKEFWEYFQNIRGLQSEIFGQNSNDNGDKRERLLVDEINANNERTAANGDKRLYWRRKFCDWCRDAFGLEISVDYRKGVYSDVDDTDGLGGPERDRTDVPGGEYRQPDAAGDN